MKYSQKQKEIRAKGFKMEPPKNTYVNEEIDFGKMKVGLKTLTDAVISLNTFKTTNRNYGDKEYILQVIAKHDYETLREISEYFYEVSGIYQRMCKYLAYLYRYDWYVTSFMIKDTTDNSKKILADFSKVLNYLDNSQIKRLFGDIALEVVKTGVYYGCVVDFNDKFAIQQLPAKYCRSRFAQGVTPVIELNLRFFDNYFPNITYRLKVLKSFPKEVQKAYVQYKEGKLLGDYPGDDKGWCMLDPDATVFFNLNGESFPALAQAIPSIIDLDQAQELDRKKTMQQLLKIVIQKLPLDKNGDLIFDVDEAKDIHNNAVSMLRRAVGVDVLTTFADIDVADMQDSNSTTKTDDLAKVERTVFNNLGVSQNLFNTDGNLALDKSILNDEALMRDLVYQFEGFLNKVVKKFNKSAYTFKVCILETTINNYKDLSKTYKEQTQMGYSKMLPQIALGHSQSSIIASIQFENNILHLADIMIPPVMSSTMSGKTLEQNKTSREDAGRPEKDDSEKSEKTIANKEAMN